MEKQMSVDIEGIYFDFDVDLRRFLRSRVSDPAAVDDVLQETYLRIHRYADSLRESDKLQSWVYQIARNALVDYYRRQRDSVELPESLAMPDDSDDDNPAARELARSIRHLLQCLPEKYQQALVLTEFEGLKQHELAEHLGLSLSGAKSRVQRAREKLKKTLLDCCHVELDRRGQVLSYAPNCADCAGDDSIDTLDCGTAGSEVNSNLLPHKGALRANGIG
jgi:RNA polymerase sigma-70 factor, ECF subfamily